MQAKDTYNSQRATLISELCNILRWFLPIFLKHSQPGSIRIMTSKSKNLHPLIRKSENPWTFEKKHWSKIQSQNVQRKSTVYIDHWHMWSSSWFCFASEVKRQKNRPIGYWSRTFCEPEKDLDTTHRECFDVVWVLLVLWPYLTRTRFTIRTDPHPLRSVLNLADAPVKLAR